MEYDPLAFEKVSIAEAKSALQEREATSNPQQEDWSTRRRPEIISDKRLTNETCVWLVALPPEVRPLRLARKFPRIANRIAGVWQRPVECDKVFDDLMIDRRGTRQGFLFEVAKEIADLRAYFSTEVYRFDIYYNGVWTMAP